MLTLVPNSLKIVIEPMSFVSSGVPILLIFIAEYILRIWSAPNRMKEVLRIYSVMDLIAILPIFFSIDTYQVLRIFRALRVLRLIRFLEGSHFFYKKIWAF